MDPRPNSQTRTTVLVIGLVVASAGAATALMSDTDIEGKIIEHEIIENASVDRSDIRAADISNADLDGSKVGHASISDVTIEKTYLNDLSVRDALLIDSRVDRATLTDVTLHDVTVCRAEVNEDHGFGDCRLVDLEAGERTDYARIATDAPATIAPGESYDIEVREAVGDTLTVRNDPSGLVGLGFEPEDDPLGVSTLGFTAAASNESVASLHLIVDGEEQMEFAMGETIDLPSEDFTLRVNTSDSGIIDHSRLALVLDLDGHGLRPAMTSFEVVATVLAFAPEEAQLFAPFYADDVARLVLTVGVDANGNVDRDLDIEMTADVTAVHAENVTMTGDMEDRVNLHDDSRLFSPGPFTYNDPVLSAHHPQTLELLVRSGLVPGLTQGAINAYGTHLVGISPYAMDVTLDATTQNANGETLNATFDVEMPAAPEEERTQTFFGTDFTLPGRGTLEVRFVDGDGRSVAAGSDWSLFIQETPDSHEISQSIAIDEGATSVSQELSASVVAGTPLGNFAESAYLVCVDHDGQRDCANDGDLVSIETGETASVEIMMG